MTREEFAAKYRARLLLFITEAWAVRQQPPSHLGLTLDRHYSEVRKLLGDIWEDFNPILDKPAAVGGNGHANRRN